MTLLRPGLGRRVGFLLLALPLLALSVVAIAYAPLVGVVGTLGFGFATGVGLVRLLHPRSYATELHADGFRTYDTLGRPVHDVRWAEIEHLTVFPGNGFAGPGTVLHVAWRCRPRQPGSGQQPWVRGGVNSVGEEYDGALPDPYLGIDEILALFQQRTDDAHRRQRGDATGPAQRS